MSASTRLETGAPRGGPPSGGSPTAAPTSSVPPMRPTDAIKRLVLGRPLATHRLEHERLGKPTALAVFASDNLSSSAYATEEIMRVLVPIGGVAAFSLVMPISIVIVAILGVLLFSYRQTIKAYPTAGGAYIVTKDNFGLLPAQVAGVALLTDYVLTVAVSVAAGVQALTSVTAGLHPYRIWIAIAFIWLIAWGNLRGVRESGRMFALPTYLFILSMLTMLSVGVVRVLTGSLPPLPIRPTPGSLTLGTAAIGLFVVLRAFASGGAAVTGVEAISNGIPAFKKPEWKNARTTLMWMGSLLGIMFLGLGFLAAHLRVVPVADESKSVLAQVGQAVYGNGAAGHAMYLVLQGATMMILVLAANTSFADFPRLANFHAADHFLPRQFTKRGHRLVFSAGIIFLAAASTVLVVVFKASVTNLIPLYALGVFTSFTLSQAGMARRHLRLREPGWRRGLLINGIGATATFLVDVIIAVVKFTKGAWAVMVFVPILVLLLVRMNHQYEREDEELDEGLRRRQDEAPPLPRSFVVLVDALDEKTLHAVQYALTVGPRGLRLIHLASDRAQADALLDEWQRRGPNRPLEIVECEAGRAECLAAYVTRLRRQGQDVTVIVPGPARLTWWERIRQGRTGSDLVRAMLDLDGVSVTVVREHGGEGHALAEGDGRVQPLPRPRHVVLLLVDRLDASVLRALRYAESLEPLEIRAVHVADDPERARVLLEQWAEAGHLAGIPLETVYTPDRNIARAVSQAVAEAERPDTEVTVVVPRRDYARGWHRLLHDRTSRTIARALEGRPHVDVVVVPFHLGRSKLSDGQGPAAGDAGSREPQPRTIGAR